MATVIFLLIGYIMKPTSSLSVLQPLSAFAIRSQNGFFHNHLGLVPGQNSQILSSPNSIWNSPQKNKSAVGNDGRQLRQFFAEKNSYSVSSSRLFARPLKHYFPTSPYALPPTLPGDDMMTNLNPGQRIVAFGDVHGDLGALCNFLQIAEVMDPNSTPENPKWIGGETICVQCGDILDRGNEELACFRLLASLSQQARDHGGTLHILYGNHESLTIQGSFYYANEGGNLEFEHTIGRVIDKAMGNSDWRIIDDEDASRRAAFEPAGLFADDLMSKMKVAVVVGRTVFVHAGLKASDLRTYGGIEGMNRSTKEWIVEETEFETYESSPGFLFGDPVWMRDYSNPRDVEIINSSKETMIDEALEELGHGVQRMVMGHTPQKRINSAFNEKAWRVDVGASKGVMGGTPEVLEIIHGEVHDTLTILTKSGERIDASDRRAQKVDSSHDCY